MSYASICDNSLSLDVLADIWQGRGKYLCNPCVLGHSSWPVMSLGAQWPAEQQAVHLGASWKKPHLMQLASKTHSPVLRFSPGCFLQVFLECFAFSGTPFFCLSSDTWLEWKSKVLASKTFLFLLISICENKTDTVPCVCLSIRSSPLYRVTQIDFSLLFVFWCSPWKKKKKSIPKPVCFFFVDDFKIQKKKMKLTRYFRTRYTFVWQLHVPKIPSFLRKTLHLLRAQNITKPRLTEWSHPPLTSLSPDNFVLIIIFTCVEHTMQQVLKISSDAAKFLKTNLYLSISVIDIYISIHLRTF